LDYGYGEGEGVCGYVDTMVWCWVCGEGEVVGVGSAGEELDFDEGIVWVWIWDGTAPPR